MAFCKVETCYVYRTFNDGTIGLFVFDQAKLDPHKPWTEQLELVIFADRKPYTEFLVDAAGSIMAVAQTAGILAQELRDSAIKRAGETARVAPINPEELTKLAAYFEGVSLDPGDDLMSMKEKLQKHDEEDKHSEGV